MSLFFLALGCAGPDLCKAQAECERLDERVMAECQAAFDRQVALADQLGCAREYRAQLDCMARSGECDESGEPPVFQTDLAECADEQEAWSDCVPQ